MCIAIVARPRGVGVPVRGDVWQAQLHMKRWSWRSVGVSQSTMVTCIVVLSPFMIPGLQHHGILCGGSFNICTIGASLVALQSDRSVTYEGFEEDENASLLKVPTLYQKQFEDNKLLRVQVPGHQNDVPTGRTDFLLSEACTKHFWFELGCRNGKELSLAEWLKL